MLDKKDKQILEQLKQNSRSTIRNIAKQTNLRPSTVHTRIKKLTKEKTIEKFTIKLNNEKAQEDFIVWVWVKTNSDISNKTFQDKRVKEVFGITGEYDLIIKLKCADLNDFNKFIHDFRKTKGVKNTLTMVTTMTIKEEI